MPITNGTERQRARRERILEATRELVTNVGYEGLTMRELAARANVSPTTLYNLYVNKDELLFAAVGDHMSGSLQQARSLAPNRGYEQLVRIVEVLAIQVQTTPEYAEAIAKALFQAAPDSALAQLLVVRTNLQCLPSLQAMQEARQLRPGVEHERVAHLLVNASWGCMLGWLKGLVPLADLRREQRDIRLSILMSISRGAARRHMEEWLDSEPDSLRLRRRLKA
ncbi:MAG: TetR/AcrR family transcriptional regulator [Gammaproteobacteria bacterium]|nr:TetR/AcrR family transcriptional regulator [Gammaproteobacteria bacterium]